MAGRAIAAGFLAVVLVTCRPAQSTMREQHVSDVGGVRLELTTDRNRYAPGDTIVVTLTVIPVTDTAVTVRFPSGQRYDFVLREAGGAILWRWSAGRGFIQVLSEETVAQDQPLRYTERLPAPPRPGRYRLAAVLASSSHPSRAEVAIQVGL